jgi:uncharacterized protein (TIGR02466 family)
MNPFLQSIFPTPLLVGASDNAVICQKACALAYTFRSNAKDALLVSDQWTRGTRSSSQEEFGHKGVTSFSSASLLKDPAWGEVASFIYALASTMIQSVNNNPAAKPSLLNMWTTIYPRGAFVPEHVHSNALLSGVFYAHAPEGCGNLVFKDPAYVAKTMFLRTVGEFPSVGTRHVIEVKTGTMVIFPAWLPHQTEPNESKEDRIIISFNLNMVENRT